MRKKTVSVTLLARVGDSKVLNEIATIEAEGTLAPLPEEHAPEAVGAIRLDLAGALMAVARDLAGSR